MLKIINNLFITGLFFIFTSLFSAIAFAGTPPDFAHSGISVSSAVPADGQTQAVVTVTLKNTSGIAVKDDTVVLKSPNDSTVIISPTSNTIDSEGHAIFRITSRSPGTYKLNVIDTTTNTPFNGLGNVIFNPTSGQYPCTNPAPGSAPQLTLAEAISPNKVALIWKKSSDPVSHYSVSYGLASNQYQYGNPRIGGRDATAFVVESLTPNTKYYFTVKAVNGCTPGSSSNELSATTLAVTEAISIPTPTSISTTTPSTPPIAKINSPITTQAPTPTSPIVNPTQTESPAEFSALTDAKIVILFAIIVIIFCIFALVLWIRENKL